jgi:hypothetical protein
MENSLRQWDKNLENRQEQQQQLWWQQHSINQSINQTDSDAFHLYILFLFFCYVLLISIYARVLVIVHPFLVLFFFLFSYQIKYAKNIIYILFVVFFFFSRFFFSLLWIRYILDVKREWKWKARVVFLHTHTQQGGYIYIYISSFTHAHSSHSSRYKDSVLQPLLCCSRQRTVRGGTRMWRFIPFVFFLSKPFCRSSF